MNKNLQIIALILFICIIKGDQDIIFELKRYKLPDFMHKDSPEFENTVCNIVSQQNPDSKKFYAPEVKTEEHCGEGQEIVATKQMCINRNLYYNTNVYLSDRNNKGPLQLAVDLTTPWTWIKKYKSCRFYSRDGLQELNDNCQVGNFNRGFNCIEKNNCYPTNKCGEIDYQSEGLSVIGEFADTRLRFENSKDEKYGGVHEQRIILAEALSGYQQLQADGVVGFGRPPTEIQAQAPRDQLEGYMLEQENQQRDYMKETGLVNNIEEKTSVLLNFQNQNPELNQSGRQFSLYIADNYEEDNDDDFKPHIQLGGNNQDKYLINKERHPMQWIPLYHEKYYYWQVAIKSIDVYFYTQGKSLQEVKEEIASSDQQTISGFQNTGLISLSTTALSIPKQQMDDFIAALGKRFEGINTNNCTYGKEYMYNLICTGLDSKLVLQNIYIEINFSDDEHLFINPKDLIQACRKQEDGTHDCIFNLQRSFDDHTILGEVVLKNYYWIFDRWHGKIGFGPAKTEYNESAFKVLARQAKEEAEEIFEEAVRDIEFMIRFGAILIILVIAFLSFKNIDCVINYIDKFLPGQKRIRIDNQQLQENEDFVDLREQQEQQQYNNYNQEKIENPNYDDFDSRERNQQRQGILNQTEQRLQNPFDSDDEDDNNGQIDLDDLSNGI